MVRQALLMDSKGSEEAGEARTTRFCCSRLPRRMTVVVLGYVELIAGLWLFLHLIAMNVADLEDNQENVIKLDAMKGKKRQIFLKFLPGTDELFNARHQVNEDERVLLLWGVACLVHMGAALAALLAACCLRRVFLSVYALVNVVLVAAAVIAALLCVVGYRTVADGGRTNVFHQSRHVYLAYLAQFVVYAATKLYLTFVAARVCCACC